LKVSPLAQIFRAGGPKLSRSMRNSALTTKITKDTKVADDLNSNFVLFVPFVVKAFFHIW